MRVRSLLFSALALCSLGCQGASASGRQDAPAAPPALAQPRATTNPPNVPARRFRFEYRFGVPATGKPTTVVVPIPTDDAHQRIRGLALSANTPGQYGQESRHGNRFWRTETSGRAPIEVVLQFDVERHSNGFSAPHRDPSKYLGSDRLVPVGDAVLEPILAEVRQRAPRASREDRARSLFDWVVDNLEYKKVGSGWGNGDTYWACSARYGNCTDFHALLIALLRTEGIPARFEMGFPIPEDRSSGQVKGYHCWVELYLPGRGWLMVDASEAAKHGGRKSRYYGLRAADRVRFSSGRDIDVGVRAGAPPLNYFIYPHIEVDSKTFTGSYQRRFSYRTLPPAD